MMIRLLIFLLSASCVCMGADVLGTVKRTEATPAELDELSIVFERLTFTFSRPVQGRFWIEFQSGNKAVVKQAVPSDAVPAAASFALTYIQTGDEMASVSVTTTHDGREDRRTGQYGVAAKGGTRSVTYVPTEDAVPIGRDFVLFSTEIQPSWRRPKAPVQRFRIVARFEAGE